MADPRSLRSIKLACAWCGPAVILLGLGGFALAGMLPVPLSPHASTHEVVSFYADHPTRTGIGFVISTLGLPLVLPLVGLITYYLLRIEGRHPLLSFVQAVSGAATSVLLLVPIILMATLTFRPDRPAALTVSLNDFAWLLFITPIVPFMVQNVAIGVAILGDRSESPLFPRWVGYTNLLVAFAFTPDVLPYFLKSGPFAWNGVFVFWLAFTAYAVFLVVMWVSLRRLVHADHPVHAARVRGDTAPAAA